MKKTKRLTIALVASLCFLLVLALSFGLTGAWYNASRSATGTITLDNGIILTVKNLNRTENLTSLAPTGTVAGSLNELDNGALVNLSKAVQPGATIVLANPSIAAAQDSVDFYAKAKIVYYVRLIDSTTKQLTGDYIDLSTLYTRAENPNYGQEEEPQYIYSAATAGSFFTTAPAFATGWTATANDAATYYYGSAGTLTEIVTASGDIGLLANAASQSYTPAAGKEGVERDSFVTLTVADVDAEFGGPRLYSRSGEPGECTYTEVQTGLLQIELYISVIQADNLSQAATTSFISDGITVTAPTISNS